MPLPKLKIKRKIASKLAVGGSASAGIGDNPDERPAGRSNKDMNDYFNERYETNKRVQTKGNFWSEPTADINKPVEPVVDLTKPMKARDYQGDWPYRAPASVVNSPKYKMAKNYKAAEFNAQDVQIDRSKKKR